MIYDIVVIGLGGIQSFALQALAKQLGGKGKRILGIGQYQCVHTKGLSHGESQIYQRSYFENEGYIFWIDFSIHEFEKLEQESNASILGKCSNLILQDKQPDNNEQDNSTTKEKNYLQLAMDAVKWHNIEVELLEQGALKKYFSKFCYTYNDAEMIGLLELGSGFVCPKQAMAAALHKAQISDGVTFYGNTRVEWLKEVQTCSSGEALSNSRPLIARLY